MKYNLKVFNNEVSSYQKSIKDKISNVKGKLFFVEINLHDKDAFYSLAPLSKAIHTLQADMHVVVYEKESPNLKLSKEVWNIVDDRSHRLKTAKVIAFDDFIQSVNKRTDSKGFEDVIQPPDVWLKGGKDGFSGTIDLEYSSRWHKDYRFNDISKTCRTILKDGYNLKKDEKMGVSFVLIPEQKYQTLPLEDYLDSFSIAYGMALSVKKLGAMVSLGSTSDRFSMLAKAVRSADFMSTMLGCELEKEIDEEVFIKFKPFSEMMGLKELQTNQASFGIHGKGYGGKFFFADNIGYPTLDKKTRWESVGRMLMKDRFEPQTKFETRDPKMRHGITETLPIDIFITTCSVNYDKIRARSKKVKDILDKCEYVRIIGKQMGKYKTDFTVHLKRADGTRREFIAHDCDVRGLIDQEYYEKTGIKAGNFANFPGGESFVTPESVKGLIIGDVVINVDQSYIIPEKKPLIISVDGDKYLIVDGPKDLVAKMRKEKQESMERIRNYEKNCSLPKEITDMYRRNFEQIGEFAINLNPKAKLCQYLIVNEKIARMIHVALGMGFEPDKKTTYHWDIVINSPRQEFDIYGVDKDNKSHWVIKKGKFTV